MSARIEDYALVGDCETAALVSRGGSIDWLCWPRFDSAACFAALLGTPEHGRWSIAPKGDPKRIRRRYRGQTLILETCFETAEGEFVLIDFMPLRGGAKGGQDSGHAVSDLVRLVRGVRGRVPVRMELVLRFGYGKVVPWVTRRSDGAVVAIAGPDLVALHTHAPTHGENLTTVAEFEVSAGDTVPFVLSYGASHLPPPRAVDPDAVLDATQSFWKDWAGHCESAGPYSEAVTRSLITLKSLTYAPTGGIVAAPTTSLPERIGGSRNWDYRYCWLRDATLTLLALTSAGYFDEARAWRDWLLRAIAGRPSELQIMYGVAGERRLAEWEVPWLPGYENSQPVRIGNAASTQLQLDVFGEVMDALHQARAGGMSASGAAWDLQRALMRHLKSVWTCPDEGIWETRGGARHLTYSKVMAWTALDRAIKSAEGFGLDGPLTEWRALRQTIHEDVCAHGFDADMNSFVQSYGSKHMDASLLLLPSVGFLPASDPRIRGTVAAVERHLLRDGFLLRYDSGEGGDGLPAGEGTFLACSFWLADAWLMQGRRNEATALFERLLSIRNDVGLLAEEFDPRLGRQVGNFPQAFSHVALINTAYNLAGARQPTVERGEAGAPRPPGRPPSARGPGR